MSFTLVFPYVFLLYTAFIVLPQIICPSAPGISPLLRPPHNTPLHHFTRDQWALESHAWSIHFLPGFFGFFSSFLRHPLTEAGPHFQLNKMAQSQEPQHQSQQKQEKRAPCLMGSSSGDMWRAVSEIKRVPSGPYFLGLGTHRANFSCRRVLLLSAENSCAPVKPIAANEGLWHIPSLTRSCKVVFSVPAFCHKAGKAYACTQMTQFKRPLWLP